MRKKNEKLPKKESPIIDLQFKTETDDSAKKNNTSQHEKFNENENDSQCQLKLLWILLIKAFEFRFASGKIQMDNKVDPRGVCMSFNFKVRNGQSQRNFM